MMRFHWKRSQTTSFPRPHQNNIRKRNLVPKDCDSLSYSTKSPDLSEKSGSEPALVTVALVTLYACSETVIELNRVRTIKLEPGFPGGSFAFA